MVWLWFLTESRTGLTLSQLGRSLSSKDMVSPRLTDCTYPSVPIEPGCIGQVQLIDCTHPFLVLSHPH